jgi:hypothetical protein
MDTNKLLEQIQKLFESNTSLLRKDIKESEVRVKSELQEELKATKVELQEELKKAIVKSQEETIDALTDLINEGYNQHEGRIQAIEEHLHISHSQ